MMLKPRIGGLLFVLLGLSAVGSAADAVVTNEFIYEKAPFPEVHASTIEEGSAGLVAAFFGGTEEKNKDVGIWVSRQIAEGWSPLGEVANGVQANGEREPCWNPVLFQPKEGPLLLFFKVGPSPSEWWGELIVSHDGGKTWGERRRLPDGILGPIKNKPIQLADGTIVCPTSSEHDGWRVHVEFTKDLGKTWASTEALNDGKAFGAIQPTFFRHGGDKLQMLCRGTKQHVIEGWSEDGGKTWSELKPIDLPNPNSGIDGVTLKDGRHVLIYNHTPKGRSPLNLGLSADGKSWKSVLVLEDQPGEYSYPAVIQTKDGRVHITYTWKRQKVRHVVVDPAKLASSK